MLCCIHDCLKHYRFKTFGKENPLILGQILENQAFFVGGGVVLGKYSIERSRSKWHSRDLGILRWRCHQGEVDFAHKNTMDRLPGKLCLESNFEPCIKEDGSQATRKPSRDWHRVSAQSSR